MHSAVTLEAIAARLTEHGLIVRGGFYPEPNDGIPPLANGRAAATVVMIGNAGPAMWRQFGSTALQDSARHPFNRYVERVAAALWRELGAEPLLPFSGPPYWPFQRWALRAESIAVSPIGLLIHPDYGLWHAYRAVLLFADVLALPARVARPSPCATCADKPCLSTCPVRAFEPGGYDVEACATHVASDRGADCLGHGCRARRACPIGRDYVYAPAQAEFHMRAFLAARSP